MYQSGTKYILGIKPEIDGLSVNPCIPGHWDGFEVERKFRGNTYKINVKNPDHISKGIKSLVVNGKKIDGFVIPYNKTDTLVLVEVIMG